MLLFLALRCPFAGGVLGAHGKGRKAPEAGLCPAQVSREHSGVWVGNPSLWGHGEERRQMEGGRLMGTAGGGWLRGHRAG